MVDISQRDLTINFIPNASFRNDKDKWRAILHVVYFDRHEEEATDYVFDTYDQAMEYAKGYAALRLKHAQEAIEYMKENLHGNRLKKLQFGNT